MTEHEQKLPADAVGSNAGLGVADAVCELERLAEHLREMIEGRDYYMKKAQRLRSALIHTQFYLLQSQPCAAQDCQAEQAEWKQEAIDAIELALEPNV